MQGNRDQIVRFQILGNAENGFFILFFEGAKQAVKYDEGIAIILVDVGLVGAVVDAVVRGRIDEPFQYSQLGNDGGMLGEGKQKCDRFNHHGHHRIKAQQWHRSPKYHVVKGIEKW